jgi:vancomycin resistance protein YoaR
MQTTTISTPNQSRSLPAQLALAVLFSIIFFFVLLIIALIVFQLSYNGLIFPGVSVAGVDLSGLTPDQAVVLLSERLDYPERGRIILQEKDQQWIVAPNELGFFLDPQTTANRAYLVGRSSNLFQSISDQYTAWHGGTNLGPALIFDERTAQNYLDGLAQTINKPLIEANLTLNGVEVVVNSGQIGRELDIPSSLALITSQLTTLQDGIVNLVVKDLQPVVLDATQQAELAKQILSQPLILKLPDGQPDMDKTGPWTFDPNALAAMLRIERVSVDGVTTFQITLNSDTLRSFLANLAPSLQLEPKMPRFIFNDETLLLDILEHAVIGRTLDVEATIQSIQQKLTQGEHTIPLEFVFNSPPVTDQTLGSDIGITELVHKETSYFYGSSAARVQNIELSSSKFHGLLIAPGQTVSMAEVLGDVSMENGYAEALIIYNGQTIKGVGGGVCQVSSTLFRAAFFTGYPILERHPHAYRVSYYEKIYGNKRDPNLAGLDATVFVPLVDLKFTNDTPYWLLMETYVNPSASTLTWKFYSTKDGRTVDWDTTGPTNVKDPPAPVYKENPDLPQGEIKQVDWAVQGASVVVTRIVYRDGQVLYQDTIRTVYQPWGDVFEYGPGTEGIPTPAP